MTFKPDWGSPPGDTIMDSLEEMGKDTAWLGDETEWNQVYIHALIRGDAAVTVDVAEVLAEKLGHTPHFWLRREAQYRSDIARNYATTSES